MMYINTYKINMKSNTKPQCYTSPVSHCCDALPYLGMIEYGICGHCKEHCEFYSDDDTDL